MPKVKTIDNSMVVCIDDGLLRQIRASIDTAYTNIDAEVKRLVLLFNAIDEDADIGESCDVILRATATLGKRIDALRQT